MTGRSSQPVSTLELSAAPVAIVLAGGWASRMGGGDKGMRTLGGVPILRRVVERARGWTDRVLLSVNDDPARFTTLDWLAGIPVLADDVPGRPGPLAGILAAMDWAAAQAPGHTHVLSLPCDTPFLPDNLWPALAKGMPAGAVAVGPEGIRHPTVALWPVTLREDLRTALCREGLRKVGAFAARHGLAELAFPTGPGGIDPFFNINNLEDLAQAETLIRSAGP